MSETGFQSILDLADELTTRKDHARAPAMVLAQLRGYAEQQVVDELVSIVAAEEARRVAGVLEGRIKEWEEHLAALATRQAEVAEELPEAERKMHLIEAEVRIDAPERIRRTNWKENQKKQALATQKISQARGAVDVLYREQREVIRDQVAAEMKLKGLQGLLSAMQSVGVDPPELGNLRLIWAVMGDGQDGDQVASAGSEQEAGESGAV